MSRLVRLVVLALFVFTLATDLVPSVAAQEISPTADLATETPSPTETAMVLVATATSEPTATETFIPVPSPSDTATSTIAADFQLDLTATASEPALPTSTATQSEPTATPTATFGAASLSTGANVTVHLGDASGPVVPNVCASLYTRDWHQFQSRDCANASGLLFLPVLNLSTGPKQYTVEVENTPGYSASETWVATLPYGTVQDVTIWVNAEPNGTEILDAVDGVTGDPVGGACWEYHTGDNSGSAETLAIGPVCDTDNDGTVSVSDITYGPYCLFVTPPAGYEVVGNAPVCADAQVRNGHYVKAMVSQAQGSAGSVHVSASTSWGLNQADICFKISAPIGGNPADFSAACTDGTGAATVGGLVDGAYTISFTGVPSAFQYPVDQSIAIMAGQTTELAIALTIKPAGDVVITSLLYFGPETLPGACYSYVTNDNGKPGATVVLGPVCDTDADGITTITGVPRGPFCVTVTTSPVGYYRKNNDGYSCDPDMRAGSGSVGFSPIPQTPTATATKTPRPPTNTPTATATKIPTAPPAGNEPNAGLLVKNCAYDGIEDYGQTFSLCQPAPSGVKFGVLQNGTQVASVTTGANGAATVTLTNRLPYTLHYLSGNSTWTSGPGEETRLRYDSSGTVYMVPNSSVDRTWNLTVNVARSIEFVRSPLGGACFKIVGRDNAIYVDQICDTDNDGTIAFGQLPPRFDSSDFNFYSAVMTVAPIGYSIWPSTFGIVSADTPNTWTANITYLDHVFHTRTVDSDGNLLTSGGFCYQFAFHGPGGDNVSRNCDFHGIQTDGNLYFDPGTAVTITLLQAGAGYTVDIPVQNTTVPTEFERVITFVAHKYGTSSPSQADIRINLMASGSDHGPDYGYLSDTICLNLTPNTGTPQGNVCADGKSKPSVIFRNLNTGTYTIGVSSNSTGCSVTATQFTIAAGDLGTEKQVSLAVDCGPGSDSCVVFHESPGRTVDLWYGTVYDQGGNVISTGLQLSESLPKFAQDSLLAAAIPDPSFINASSLAAWTDPFVFGDNSIPWDQRPDYDNNAQGILTKMWNAHPGAVVDSPVSRGSVLANGSVDVEFYFIGLQSELDPFPECNPNSGFVTVTTLYNTTFRFHQLDAHIPAPTATATASPTGTATAVPSPAAVCTTTITRDLTAYFGTLTDDSGHKLGDNLALSDHIPAALRDAIRRADSPGKVKSLIAHWVDTGLVEEDWATGPTEGLDPAGGIADQYGTMATDVMLDEPIDLGMSTYSYITYVLRDANRLPVGCISPADLTDASLGPLVPVLQTTIVHIHFVQQDAIATGHVLPTATPTETATALDPTATSQPDDQTATATATDDPGAIATATDRPNPSPEVRNTATAAVTTLPNTGASPSDRSTTNFWILIMLLATCLLGAIGFLRLHRR